MKLLPPIPESLVKALKERYPDRAPTRGTSYHDIMFEAGQVDVVRFLERQYELQQEGE